MSATHHAFDTTLGPLDGLLDRAPLPLETGIARLAGDRLLVAVRTDLPGCKGRMVDWWFKFFETTQHIRWWHPHDHVAHYGWDRNWKKGHNYVGATIHAVESLAGIPPVAAQLKFHDPRELFGASRLADAQSRGDVSAAIYAAIGFGDDIAVDDNADPRDGRMLHLVRDTPDGCVLRSRFVLGLAADEPLHAVPDALGLNLMRHCYTEFTYLAKFLPSLYYGEHANGELAPLPW